MTTTHRIVLDPGHGGDRENGGSSPNRASGPNGLLEKELTLDIARRVQRQLAAAGAQVVLTRDADVNPGIAERIAVATEHGAQSFISIHFNASDDPGRRGSIAYIGRGAGERARALADALLFRVNAVTGGSGEVISRNLSVINPSKHPPGTAAVLLETAYLSHPDTARRLADEGFRDQLAGAIASAIAEVPPLRLVAGRALQSGATEIPLAPGSGGLSIDERSLEIGDIFVSTTTDTVSGIIRAVSDSAVSHAGLYVGDGMVVESIGSGVQLKTLEQALADDFYAVALRRPDLTEEQRLRIRDFAGQQLDRSYDFRAVAMHGLYRLAAPVCDNLGDRVDRMLCHAARWQIAFGNDDADRWFCSELVFAAYDAAGVSLGVLPVAGAPQDLLTLDPPLEYVGHLKAVAVPVTSQALEGELMPHCGDEPPASSQALGGLPLAGLKRRPLARQQSIQNITHAGSFRLAYDRLPAQGYGVIEPLPGRNTRNFRGTADLQAALDAWAVYLPAVESPAPAYILTGGLLVNKPGEHGAGRAADIDGLWWSDTDKFLATDAPSDWWRYLRIEASLRKAFGTVLNYDYNAGHRDHWHCDLGGSTAWRAADSQTLFARRALNEIWGESLPISRGWDATAQAAAVRAGYDFNADGWDHFLDDIINQQSGSTLALGARSRGVGARSLGNNEVEVRLRLFIPAPVVDGPGGAFGGDGRGFSYNGGSARADLKARVKLRQDGTPQVTIVDRRWGESTAYASSDVVAVPGKPDWWKDKRSGARPTQRATLAASNDNLNLSVGGSTRDNIEVTMSDATVVRFHVDGGIPLMSLAPNINADLRLHLKREGGAIQAKLLGDHDGFPAYEVYVEGQRIYGYDPVAAGNTPTALFPPSDITVSTGWQTLAPVAAQALGSGRPHPGPGGLPLLPARGGNSMTAGALALQPAPQRLAQPLERAFIVVDESGGMSAARRTFGAPTHDISGETELRVRVPRLPAGGSVRWHIPSEASRARVAFAGAAGPHSANGTSVTLRALDGGIAEVDCSVRDASGTRIESNKYIVSAPEFVLVTVDASVDAFLRDRQLLSRKAAILNEAKALARDRYSATNLRFIWPGEALPGHLSAGANGAFPGGVEPARSVIVTEITADPSLINPITGSRYPSAQLGQFHLAGDFPAGNPLHHHGFARVLLHNFDHYSEVAEVEQALTTSSRPAADMDAAATMYGRMLGTLLCHEVGHFAINIATRHTLPGEGGNLMRPGDQFTFSELSGMERGGSLLTDLGTGVISYFSALVQDILDDALPVYPPLDIAARRAQAQSLAVAAEADSARQADAIAQQLVLDQRKSYEDPSQFPINLPEAGSGDDRFTIDIPEGLQFAHVDIEFSERGTLASAEVTQRPARGASGRQEIVVSWSHPPYSKIAYRIRAYASANGQSAPVRVSEGDAGAEDRLKLLVAQEVPVELLVTGTRAKLLYEALRRAQREQPQSEAAEAVTIIAALAIVVVIAAVAMLGFMMLYAVLTQAMNKGYDVRDTKYKMGGGEGATRQEHELLFNLTK